MEGRSSTSFEGWRDWLVNPNANPWSNNIVWQCLLLLSSSVAQCEVLLQRRDSNGTWLTLQNHPLLDTIRMPRGRTHPETSFNWMQTIVTHLGGYGNAFAYITEVDPLRYTLKILPPWEMSILADPEREDVTYSWLGREIPRTRLLHFKGWSLDGLVGMSPLTVQRSQVDSTFNQRSFLDQYYANSASPSVTLETEQHLEADQRKQARKEWEKTYGKGQSREGGVAVLWSGMSAKPFSLVSPADAAWVESRKLSTAELANVWGIPVQLLNQSQDLKYNSLAEIGVQFIRNGMGKVFRYIEEAMHFSLANRNQSLRFLFDSTDYQLASVLDLIAGYSKATGGKPIVTQDEARARINLPPEGGDAAKLGTPLNIGNAGGEQTPAQEVENDAEPEEERLAWSFYQPPQRLESLR